MFFKLKVVTSIDRLTFYKPIISILIVNLFYIIKTKDMIKSKKMWIALAFALAFFAKAPVYALEKLVFVLQNGQSITFALSDRPTLTFEGDKLVATNNKGEKKEIALNQVKDYSIQDETTGIEQTPISTDKPTLANGHVYYEGLKEGVWVRIIAMNGQEIACHQAPANGKLDIDLTTLNKGVYIIQAGKNTIKITR